MYQLNDVDRARHVLSKALVRMEDGHTKYGQYNPEKDTRDLWEWAQEELLDCINYTVFLSEKLDHVRRTVEEDTLAGKVRELEAQNKSLICTLQDIQSSVDGRWIQKGFSRTGEIPEDEDENEMYTYILNYVYHIVEDELEKGGKENQS